MDGGNLGNNNRNPNGGSNRLSAESLPSIDTRLLSQSELRALSLCSSLSPSSSSSLVDDDLTPKIDRSVFNESAGSRKQTFQRLRLARHPPPPPRHSPSPQKRQGDDDSSREEVASLLRSLFSVDSTKAEEEDEREDEIEGQALISLPIRSNNSIVYQNPYFDSVQGGISGGEERTRKRPGRPRKIPNPSDDLGINPGKRKRGRPPKSRDKEESVGLENREGAVVDVNALACVGEDPYGEELRRITVGLVSNEELFGFLEEMSGEWVSGGKVVKACDFGGYLPVGWKLMLCVKRQGSSVWLACHRYVSPDGQEFATCKEVSTYLQALLGSRSKNQLNSLQSDNNYLEQPVMATNESLVGNSDSMGFPVTNQNLLSKRTRSEEVERSAENGNTTDPVKTRLDDEDNKGDDMKKRDDNMENVAVLLNSEAEFGRSS